MENKAIETACKLLDKHYPSVTTAFLTESHSDPEGCKIQVIIINDLSGYHSFEYFKAEQYDAEIIIFPNSVLNLTYSHIDFLVEYDIFSAISKGILIKDKNAIGERLQQVFEVVNTFQQANQPVLMYKDIFKLSRLTNKLQKCKRESGFSLKAMITTKTAAILKNHPEYYEKMLSLEESFFDNQRFLKNIKLILDSLGGPITFYSDEAAINSVTTNCLSIRFDSQFSYDDFISRFMIFLFDKLKAITHKINFSFKVTYNYYLLTIRTDIAIITNHVIPTLNHLFISNLKLYNTLKPKYPFDNTKQLIDEMFFDKDLLRHYQSIISKYILELRLNDGKVMSDGYRLSLGLLFTIEILQIICTNKDCARKYSNILFEKWLPLSYDTSETNFSDLELQSYKLLNEFENMYLSQYDTLTANYGEELILWRYKNNTLLDLQALIGALRSSHKRSDLFALYQKDSNPETYCAQILLFEALSILGISNYNKCYIIYSLNRLLHEA